MMVTANPPKNTRVGEPVAPALWTFAEVKTSIAGTAIVALLIGLVVGMIAREPWDDATISEAAQQAGREAANKITWYDNNWARCEHLKSEARK